MTTRVLAVMLLAMLTVAPAADAECAWVLWSEWSGSARAMLLPGEAFRTREECQTEKARQTEKVRRELKDKPEPLIRILPVSCLPDTVDPRGPKGK